MPRFSFLFLLLAAALLTTGCIQQQIQQRQVRQSPVVVLDIGHYYEPSRGGQGARTPDARYGIIEECEFWYKYAGYVKEAVEAAGYQCIICNRGSLPADPILAAAAKKAGVIQVNSLEPTAIYRSKHHPNRMAVGMLSADFALDQKPGAVVFLHHNSNSDNWLISNKGAFYCNEAGVKLASVMAQAMNREILDKGMPNHHTPCGVIIRNDGRKGGGDWLNTCNESYVPAVITEVAFLSNPEHAQFLSKPANAIRYARAIGHGIAEYMKNR